MHVADAMQDGATPLPAASDKGHKDVVAQLLARGADVNKAMNVRSGGVAADHPPALGCERHCGGECFRARTLTHIPSSPA